MDTNPAKPGYKTTELYVTIIAMVLSYLATRGVIAVSQVDPLLTAFQSVVQGGAALLFIFGLARSYLQSRTAIKQKLLDNQQSTVQ